MEKRRITYEVEVEFAEYGRSDVFDSLKATVETKLRNLFVNIVSGGSAEAIEVRLKEENG